MLISMTSLYLMHYCKCHDKSDNDRIDQHLHVRHNYERRCIQSVHQKESHIELSWCMVTALQWLWYYYSRRFQHNISADSVAHLICTFAKRYSMLRCDELFLRYYCPTYVNMALNQQSRIDYILATSGCHLSDFSVVDPHINFSNHLPLVVVAKCSTPSQKVNLDTTPQRSVTQLRKGRVTRDRV